MVKNVAKSRSRDEPPLRGAELLASMRALARREIAARMRFAGWSALDDRRSTVAEFLRSTKASLDRWRRAGAGTKRLEAAIGRVRALAMTLDDELAAQVLGWLDAAPVVDAEHAPQPTFLVWANVVATPALRFVNDGTETRPSFFDMACIAIAVGVDTTSLHTGQFTTREGLEKLGETFRKVHRDYGRATIDGVRSTVPVYARKPGRRKSRTRH